MVLQTLLPGEKVQVSHKCQSYLQKYSNKLSMKALVGKSMLMKIKIQRGTSSYTPFFHIYFFETQGNLKERKGTNRNSRELI